MSATADDVAGRLDVWSNSARDAASSATLLSEREEFRDRSIAFRIAASLIRSQAARIEKLEEALQSIRRLVGDDDNEQHEWTAQDMVEALQDADQTARAALERT